MLRQFLAIILILFATHHAKADMWQRWIPLGYCQLSVTTAVQTSTCTNGIPSGATWAYVCNEGTAARFRDDGTNPSTTVGVPLGTGTATAPICFSYYGNLNALAWIAESSTSVLDFSFYK